MFFNKNEKAVSPIIATLVLIVVAIVGAVAIGLLLGTFSGNVQQQTSNGQMGSTGSNHLLIGGSTTVQPLSIELAKGYMSAHPGIQIDVQGGGSGQGRIGVNNGVLDIGSASSPTDTVTAYPGLVQTEIGGSCVDVISKAATGTGAAAAIPTTGTVTAADLLFAYTHCAANTGATTAATTDGFIPAGTVCYQRSDVSGTEETFSKYIKGNDPNDVNNQFPSTCNAIGVASNGDMYSKVSAGEGLSDTLGFCDHGMITDKTLIVGVDGSTQADFQNTALITKSLKALHNGQTVAATSGAIPTGLCRNLYYLTKGQPSGLSKDYINWVLQPGQTGIYSTVGYFSTYDYY